MEPKIKILNYEKIHYYYEVWNWSYHDASQVYTWYKKPWKAKKFFLSILYILIGTLCSWATVIFLAWFYIVSFFKKWGTPEKIKEIDYKLENSLLNKKEVQHLIREKFKFSWTNSEAVFNWFENLCKFWEPWEDYISLTHYEDQYNTVSVADNLLIFYYSNPQVSSTSVYEYKIEWKDAEAKLIFESVYRDEYKIYLKDWIIYEDEFDPHDIREKEYLERKMKRHDITDILVKSLVFKSELSESSWKKYLEARIKDIEKAEEEYKDICKKYKIPIMLDDDWSFKYLWESTSLIEENKKWEKKEKKLFTKKKYEDYQKDIDKITENFWVSIFDTIFAKETLRKMMWEKN